MNAVQLLVRDVEAAVGGQDAVRRVSMLRNITNLFLEQAPQLNDDHVGLFDEVIVRLAEEIDRRARVDLSRQLASGEKAPRKTIRNLALDQDIAVAGPVLSGSLLVGSDEIWTVVRERGQDHLRAVAARADLEPGVTDLLLDRGDESVIATLVGNRNARYSTRGKARLADLLEDAATAAATSTAPFTPVPSATLFDWTKPDVLGAAIADAAAHIQHLAGRGELSESAILALLDAGQTPEALAGLALLSELPASVVTRAYGAPQPDPLMFIVRGLNFSWILCNRLLEIRSSSEMGMEDMAILRSSFDGLSIPTAQRVLRFVALRARSDQGTANDEPS